MTPPSVARGPLYFWTRVLTLRGDGYAGYEALIPVPPAGHTREHAEYVEVARELMTLGGMFCAVTGVPVTWHCYAGITR